MMGLTPRQRDCLNFIRAQVKEKGIAPSLDEICAALDMKQRSGANHLVTALLERGYVRRESGKMRGIKLAQSEYNHRPGAEDCLCPRCPARRIQYQQIIQGLQRDPEFLPGVILIGLRLLAPFDRARLLGLRNNAAPRTRTALPLEGGR